MNNLYVIAIGGSGERILRSFILSLAAGVNINASKVTPVIIDNDTKSKALENCQNLINAYRGHGNTAGVYSLYNGMQDKPSFCHIEIAEPIKLDISGQNLGTLKEVINCPAPQGDNDVNYHAIRSINEELDLLLVEQEQNMPIDWGFVGQPHIGTTVINSKALSLTGFQTVLQAGNNDGIIILGSLFGGTGAAGIPLIVNKLLQNTSNNKPQIGIIAMLPYFDTDKEATEEIKALADKNIKVRPELFDIATRAALMYYAEQDWNVDYIYYIGDDFRPIFKKVDGGNNQDNPATLHEVMAAVSIIDFANGNKQVSTTYKKPIWGFCDNGDTASSHDQSNTSGIINKELQKAIVKFKMMEQVFKHPDIMKKAIDNKADFITQTMFTTDKLNSITTDNDISFKDAAGLNYIIKAFNQWLTDLSKGNDHTVRMSRKLVIFPDDPNVDADKLATVFYAESEHSGMGLSKWEEKGWPWDRRYEAISSDILDRLQAAYRALPDQYKRNVGENRILAVTLKYISDALDKVIENTFNI